MSVNIDELFDIKISDPQKYDQITSILYQIGAGTPEGQIIFQRLQDDYGTITITESFKKLSDFNIKNEPEATIADPDTATLNINWDQLGRSMVNFEGILTPADRVSLNRTIIHELFHFIDSPAVMDFYINNGIKEKLVREIAEDKAINFANEYMAKYYGEDYRIGHDPFREIDGKVKIFSYKDLVFYPFIDQNAVAEYEYGGDNGTSMLDLFFDPNNQPKSLFERIWDFVNGDDPEVVNLFGPFKIRTTDYLEQIAKDSGITIEQLHNIAGNEHWHDRVIEGSNGGKIYLTLEGDTITTTPTDNDFDYVPIKYQVDEQGRIVMDANGKPKLHDPSTAYGTFVNENPGTGVWDFIEQTGDRLDETTNNNYMEMKLVA